MRDIFDTKSPKKSGPPGGGLDDLDDDAENLRDSGQ
jgi:hypothetical protein